MAQYRAERLAHEIQRLLSELVQSELRDPRLRLITITRAEVTRDLRHANVYVSTLADEDRAEALAGCERAKGRMRSYLASQLSLRIIPEIHFHEDTSIAGGDRVLGLLRELASSGTVVDD